MLYYLLHAYDSEFRQLFKIAADFDDRLHRTAENQQMYARMIAGLLRRDKLRPFDRSAVARIIEHGARLAGDAEKLSISVMDIADLLREADYYASIKQQAAVNRDNVQRAIDAQIYRGDRLRELLQEAINRGILMIDTDGAKIGQINGLAVMQLGDASFAVPSRITATARLGSGKVIDIERETKLGGAIHSKGVFILSSFLAERYAKDYPLSLSASLVFEQSYGGVDGDSASSAELYALLSALADAPIKQGLAVTGSVNQRGQVQAIGGVNEKIEGFFDLCQARGLTGNQGVLIPTANVKHLMLRQDVVAAVAAGQFAIYAVSAIDEGIALLTGMAAGELDGDGRYPPDSINGRVVARLETLAAKQREFMAPPEGGDK